MFFRLQRFSGILELDMLLRHFASRREKMKMKQPLTLALLVLFATGVFAQSSSSSEMKEMKDAIAAQQQQIQQLQQQIQSRDSAIQTLEQRVSQAEAAAQAAQQTANGAIPKAEDLDKQYIDPLQHDVTDLKAVSANTVEGLQDT